MPIFVKGSNAVLFIHIPKSAGSSIEKIGSDEGWRELFSVRGQGLRELSYFKATPQHLHAEVLDQIFDFGNFDSIFTVVRHPYSRLKSEYYWQRSQGITKLGVDAWVNDTFEKYKVNPYIYDNHIRPQIEFVPDYENVLVFKLEEGGVEKSREIFRELSLKSGNGSSRIRNMLLRFRPVRQEKRSNRDPEVEAQFRKHYRKISEFYKKDFEAFSYKE